MGFFQRLGLWADLFSASVARLVVYLSVRFWRVTSWLFHHGWTITRFLSVNAAHYSVAFVNYVNRQPAFKKLNNGHWVGAGTLAVSSMICAVYISFVGQPVMAGLNLTAIESIPVVSTTTSRLASFDPLTQNFGPVVRSIAYRPSDEPGYNSPDEPGYYLPGEIDGVRLARLPLLPNLNPPVVKPRMGYNQFIVRPRRRPRKGEESMRSTVSGTCLPASIKRQIARVENRFGRIRVISTFRRGARIAGTGRVSKHASCRAIDFHPPRGQYRAVLKYLRANHRGGLGTYSCGMHHIHIDNGRGYRWHHCVSKNGVPKHRRYARKRSKRNASAIITE